MARRALPLRRSGSLVAAALLALLVLPATASARSATAAEVRELAARGAVDELRRIDRVDGVPVDLRRVLSNTSRFVLEQRLRVLATDGIVDVREPADARAAAKRILAQRRYRGTDVPRPLRGFFRWIGKRLEPLGRLDDWVPGGDWVLWPVLAAIVLGAALAGVVPVARRRAGRESERFYAARAERSPDPAALEREAADAEAAGDFERALRLRFRAGLLRLARGGVVPPRESLRTGEAAALVALPEFERLAAAFDEAVYGRRTVDEADVAAARESWRHVIEKARAQ